jgi:hypothetical protein
VYIFLSKLLVDFISVLCFIYLSFLLIICDFFNSYYEEVFYDDDHFAPFFLITERDYKFNTDFTCVRLNHEQDLDTKVK